MDHTLIPTFEFWPRFVKELTRPYKNHFDYETRAHEHHSVDNYHRWNVDKNIVGFHVLPYLLRFVGFLSVSSR